jgi:hypothetical protein
MTHPSPFFSTISTEKIVKLLNRHNGKTRNKKGGEKKMKKTVLLAIAFGLLFSTALGFFPCVKAASPTPVGYWKFNEGAGTVTDDSSGNGNTGTLVNGPQWVNGISGTALSFDGSSNYVSIPHSSSLDVSGNQISIEFWMKPTVDLPVSGASMYIFDKGDSYLGIILAETTGGDAPNYGKLEFGFPFSNFNPVDTYSTTHFWAANTWYHIAFTCDGNVFRVYVNGALESTVANTGNVHPSGFSLVIGSRVSRDREFFKGIIDEFAIYDYARTAEEIRHSIFLTPATGFASATVTGLGFSNNSKVTISWDGATIPSIPHPVTTDGTGSFVALISVPTQTSQGVHIVNATDESGNWATATFTVVNMTGTQGLQGIQGVPGMNGTTWYEGNGTPNVGTGANNDYYLNTASGDVYQKQSGSWTKIGNIQGPKGDKGDIGDTGPQGPAGSLGENQLVLIAFPTAASIIALCISVAALLRRKS